MLDTLIQNLAEELELEGSLATETPGVFALPLEEDLRINISSLGQMGVTFFCRVAPCPDNQNEELFKEALLANLFGQGTGGALIGFDEAKKQLTLVKDVPYLVEYTEFKSILEDFINTVDFWRGETLNYSKGP